MSTTAPGLTRRVLAALVVSIATVSLCEPDALAVVDDANDVCAATANPCIVASAIEVVSGSTLDFGVRELRIAFGGSIDIGAGSAEIRCGRFAAQTPGEVAIRARGPAGAATQDGGTLTVRARGACTGDPTLACLDNDECFVGFCNDNICGGTSIPCDDHIDCDLGPCRTTGSVSLLGRIEAQGDMPGILFIEAAGDIVLGEDIDLDSTNADNDGGELDVISHLGSVFLSGRVEATAGRLATGGAVTIRAGNGATVGGLVDVSGGDFDGGELDVSALGDLTVSGTVRADSTNGEGAGGFVGLDAGEDLRLTATAALSANGHRSIDNFGGDGGTYFFTAGQNLTIDAGAVIDGDGARPDAAAGTVDVAAGGAIAIAGDINLIARGPQGIGGGVVAAACDIAFTSGGSITNGGEGGENSLSASRALSIASGAVISADVATGVNVFRYRDADEPPSVLGTVTPAADLEHVPGLDPCAGVSTTTTLPDDTCGNGFVDVGEDCDDGDTTFVRGDACDASCHRVACADPDDSGQTNATDALIMLRVAVGIESCALCVCNVDAVGASVTASDALRTLNKAVGLPVAVICPACAP